MTIRKILITLTILVTSNLNAYKKYDITDLKIFTNLTKGTEHSGFEKLWGIPLKKAMKIANSSSELKLRSESTVKILSLLIHSKSSMNMFSIDKKYVPKQYRERVEKEKKHMIAKSAPYLNQFNRVVNKLRTQTTQNLLLLMLQHKCDDLFKIKSVPKKVFHRSKEIINNRLLSICYSRFAEKPFWQDFDISATARSKSNAITLEVVKNLYGVQSPNYKALTREDVYDYHDITKSLEISGNYSKLKLRQALAAYQLGEKQGFHKMYPKAAFIGYLEESRLSLSQIRENWILKSENYHSLIIDIELSLAYFYHKNKQWQKCTQSAETTIKYSPKCLPAVKLAANCYDQFISEVIDDTPEFIEKEFESYYRRGYYQILATKLEHGEKSQNSKEISANQLSSPYKPFNIKPVNPKFNW